jgi:hypothetical protein
MALAGLGIGPSFAVFTLIVQNAVSADRIGVATSSLTFFQQIGGTVGLTLAGTILADRFATDLQTRIAANLTALGVPPAGIDFTPTPDVVARLDLLGPGDLGARFAGILPPAMQPLIPAFVQARDQAFSTAIAATFWIGIGGAFLAAFLVLLLREVPMRQTFEVADYAPERTAGDAPERSPGDATGPVAG